MAGLAGAIIGTVSYQFYCKYRDSKIPRSERDNPSKYYFAAGVSLAIAGFIISLIVHSGNLLDFFKIGALFIFFGGIVHHLNRGFEKL